MSMSVSFKKATNKTNIKHNNRDFTEKQKAQNSHIDFSKSDDKDLYYALRKVNLTFTRVKNGNNISYTAKVTDKFDFEREFNKSLFTTLVVNWAWLCQQTGVLHPISVGIIIKGLK